MPTDRSAARHDSDRFRIHVRVLVAVRNHLESLGWDNATIASAFARHKLETADTDSFDSFISLQAFASLLQTLSRECRDPILGLALGDQTEIGALGVLGQAFRTAPTIERAFEVITTNMKLYADVSLSSLTVSDQRVEFSWAYSPLIRPRDQLVDRAARMFVVNIGAKFDSDWMPVEVHLQRRKPTDPTLYRQYLAPLVIFDAPANVIVMRTSDLDRPNRQADAPAHEVAMELARRMSAERRVPDDLQIRVREDILMHLSEPDQAVSRTARRLGLSTRGLQRQLDGLGTSYQALCAELRMDLARELLIETNLPLSEVAFQLGFSNQANLSRAVKRWMGASPKQVRLSSSSSH